MVERDDADSDGEKDNGDEGVSEEPEGLASEFAWGIVLRDVAVSGHDIQAKITPNESR